MPWGDETRLREEIELLGRVLDETLEELRGPGALAIVERTRRAAVALRRGALPGGRSALAAAIADRPVEELALLAEAFTAFFHLVNAAEELHRIRSLRARDRAGAPPLEGSLDEAVAELAASRARPSAPGPRTGSARWRPPCWPPGAPARPVPPPRTRCGPASWSSSARSSTRCRPSTASSPRASPRPGRVRRCGCPPSSASAPGSAATGTGTPSSPPR